MVVLGGTGSGSFGLIGPSSTPGSKEMSPVVQYPVASQINIMVAMPLSPSQLLLKSSCLNDGVNSSYNAPTGRFSSVNCVASVGLVGKGDG